MHVADLSAEVVLGAQKMQANGAAAGEINPRSSRGHLCIGEEGAAADLEIRNNAAMRIERPLERERVHPHAVGGILFLNYHESGHGFDGVFQTPAEKAGPMRLRENQTVAQANVPNTVARLAAVGAMASAGPNLDFMLPFDRTRLRVGQGNT